jgi:glycosyltransferase involved in cell wall biosynthesis
MKILYHHRIGSLDGGEVVHIQELIRALERLGHDVVTLGPVDIIGSDLAHPRSDPGNGWSRLPSALREPIELCYSLIAFVRLWAACLRHRPDFIYERSNLFFLASALLRRVHPTPLLLEVNAPLARERSEHGHLCFRKLAAWSERTSWRAADHVLPVSHVLAGDIVKAGVPPERITVIPNGVRLEDFPGNPDAKNRLGLEGKIVLGFAGFVRDWHRLDQVLLLLQRPEADGLHVLIAGGGQDLPTLRREVERRNLEARITFTDAVTRQQMAAYIDAFDIALQPGVTPYASPLKLFEYMALGKAIVAPDQANIREILESGQNALLFDPDQEESLWLAVGRLSRDTDLRRRLGQAARQTIVDRRLTWDANAHRVTQIASSLLDRHQSAGLSNKF